MVSRKREAIEAAGAAAWAALALPTRVGNRHYSPPRARARGLHLFLLAPPKGVEAAGDAEEEAGDGTLGASRGAGKAEETGDGARGGGAARSGVGPRSGADADAAGGNVAVADASARGSAAEAVAAARERGGVGNKRPFASVAPLVDQPPEQRRVSAARSFPSGCGRGAGADDGASAALRKPGTHPLSITKAASRGVPKKVSTRPAGPLEIRDAGSGTAFKKVSDHAGSGGVRKKVLSPHAARPSNGEAGSGGVVKKVSAHADSGGGLKKASARGLAGSRSRGALEESAAVVSHSIASGGHHGSDVAARSLSDPSHWSAVSAADGFVDTGSKGVVESGRFVRGKEPMPLLPKPRNMYPTIHRGFPVGHSRVRVSQYLKSAPMIVKRPAYVRRWVASACKMGTINNPRDVVAFILNDDIFRTKLAAYERELESDLNVSSDVPSLMRERQCGTQNADARSKVKMVCKRFQFVLLAIVKALKRRSLKIGRIDIAAHQVIKKLPGFVKPVPIVGNIPGVEVGDQFLYRVEMALVGLHRQPWKGIDGTRDSGELIAISIVVASGRYPDTLCSSGELIYTGSGGKLAGKKSDEDQKLEGGNLALYNCIRAQTDVRVIFGFKVSREARARRDLAFTYDGLYRVVECWIEGDPGSKVYKYRLQRIPGQPELPHSQTAILRLGQ